MNQQWVVECVERWQKRLLLDHYDIRVRFNIDVDKEADAEIKIHDFYDQATVRINGDKFEHWTEAWAEAVVVHELVHVFEKRVRRIVDKTADGMNGLTTEIFWGWYETASEQMVENLAKAFLTAYGCPIPRADEADPQEGGETNGK